MKVGDLEVRIFESRAAMGKNAAEEVANKVNELLAARNEINMIFGAAPSQNEFLENLISKDLEWSRINAFHMDEYIGLNERAPQGFGNFLRDRIFNKVPFKSVHFLNGNSGDPAQECSRYEDLLRQMPPDIVCMGIGENGHIAFNDPPVADFEDKHLVKPVELDEACRRQQVNDGCFAQIDEVPTHALTLTIPALINAPYVFCVVPAPSKAQAVYNTLNEDIQHQYPSTIIKKHPNAILFLDKDSSSLLR